MKKTLWMLGVAVAALTSCTESEVLDVPESKMIGFDTFVDKPTRALGSDVNTANLNGFYVYGAYGTGAIDVINNFTVVDNDYLNGLKVYKDGSDWKYDYQPWIANNIFRFAAYVDGATDASDSEANGKLDVDNVTFIPKLNQTKLDDYGVSDENLGSWGLEFKDYEVSTKDLLVSVPFPVNPGNLSVAPAKVNVTFKHMLAKVVFEFTKSGNTEEKLSIEPFSFDAKYMGDCLVHFGEKADPNSGRLTDPHIHWRPENSVKTYEIFPLDGVNKLSWSTGTISQEFYVLPQSNANLVLSNFKIYVHKGLGEEVVKTFVMDNVSLKITDHTQWLPGQIYRYYADVTPGAYNIVFSASVDSWSDTANRDQNISTTPTPNP